jgi:bile acid:Na+ symporter, BASS family
MSDILDLTLKASLVLFMAGSLLHMGLGLRLSEALEGLRDPRFLGYGLLFGFVLGPALAWGLTRVVPLDEPYAVGLLLLGLTPCAPFLPMMVARAGADMRYAPGMMVLAAVGTVLLMPLAVPRMIPGLSVGAWTIARPLLVVILLPLLAGLAVHGAAPQLAAAMRPPVRIVTAAATAVMLVLCLVIYGRGFVEALGHFAIAAQVLFTAGMTAAGYLLGRGLAQPRRAVLGLGLCTRNVGAAMAPLLSAAAIDPRAVVMVVLAVPIQIVCAFLAARWFARDAAGRERAAS